MFRRLSVICLAMTVLAGCKIEMETDLYSSDLRSVSGGETGLTTPANLALPISSVDKCTEDTQKIVKIMEGMIASFEPKGCERKDINSFMMSVVQVPIVDSVDNWASSDELFGIVAQNDTEDANRINVFLVMNLDRYDILSDRVKDEFYQSLDLDDSTISVVLNNDEREDVTIMVDNAFVQGQPELRIAYAVSRRGQVKIDLSDVSVAFLGRRGLAPVLSLLNGGPT